METLFWISAAWVTYVYAGYPLLAWLLSALVGRRVRKAEITPRVTVLTAAYNEAACIGRTVQNKLDQDYPAGLLDVIVVSDESVDGTDEIVASLGPRVQLIRQSPRAGKTAALNLAVARAAGEILVFSDANSMYAPDTIRRLVSNFADPAVGYVTGKMVYVNEDGSLVGDGCSAYMKYENWLRASESGLAAVIGVDGGVDAVRRSAYRPMRADQQPDFVLPLSVAGQGYRVVYEPDARLHESALSEHGAEYRMRVRVTLRALWALWDMRHLMNPLRHGLLAFQIISHKLLRYLAFMPLVAAFIISWSLAAGDGLMLLAALLQTLAYVLAAVGWTGRGRNRSFLVGFPYYFVLLNVACAQAVLKFIGGQRQAIWAPRTG
ncbi:MAG: glycosyltransferase family 2 protein [Gammaproteobacteria bacterium]|jgi:cellulose synthase/poly-beta-1,6-N-acetylglucosamine synthase-like glycosyltransferase|nr:glycosyltransferase family 2 protein [Gammaproteobacteria bacterium]